jgi:uroporphyrinogen decarboxylase
MNAEQWDTIRKCARCEPVARVPVALIVDSPWIPGYLGISTLDYLFMPDVWLKANLQVIRDFPKIIFLPGFWAEMGMTAEPGAFGCRLSFFPDKTPQAHQIISSIEEVDRVPQPNPRTDGMMPMLLHWYRKLEPAINDAGQLVKIVAARGPLTVATHLLGVTEFLLGLKLNPAATHRLLRITTTLVKDWLAAQAESLKAVEGILVLDDITGFISPKDYEEFAHPYLKEIYDAFPGMIKLFHNDTNCVVPCKFLKDIPIHIFNFTHEQPISRVRELTGPDICLLGNVPPLDVLALGTAADVTLSARKCLADHGGTRGLLLSAGGGTSPGTPGANLRALVAAVAESK